MHLSESVQENEMHKLVWNFEIQTDYLISAKRPDLVIVNKKKKKKEKKENFDVPADHRVKLKQNNEREISRPY